MATKMPKNLDEAHAEIRDLRKKLSDLREDYEVALAALDEGHTVICETKAALAKATDDLQSRDRAGKSLVKQNDTLISAIGDLAFSMRCQT